MGSLDALWDRPQANDSLRARFTRVNEWLTAALDETASPPAPALMQEVDTAWMGLASEVCQAFTNASHPFEEAARIGWSQTHDVLQKRLRLIERQMNWVTPKAKFWQRKTRAPAEEFDATSAMLTLRAIFVAYAAAYRIVPDRFWKLVHAAYVKLREAKLGETPGLSAYRQILIYSLSNPYSIRGGYQTTLFTLLDYFAPLVRLLGEAPAQDSAKGLCVVALNSASAPQPVSRSDANLTGKDCVFIQLHDLTYELRQCADKMARGAPLPVSTDGNTEVTRREAIEVIESALRAYAGSSSRSAPRISGRGTIEYVANYYSVWSVLAEPDTSATYPQGSVVNQTVTGIAFKIPNVAPSTLRVGEVVTFRRSGQSEWRIGVVRWLEAYDAPEECVLIGCEAIGLRADALVAHDQAGHDTPMIIAQLPDYVGEPSIFVPDEGVAFDSQLTGTLGPDAITVLLTNLRESHIDCTRYSFLSV